MNLKMSHVLITGASKGIGLALAKEAATRGAHLYLAARGIKQAQCDELLSYGAESVRPIAVDLATQGGRAALISEMQDVSLDVLVNNAGLLTGGLLEEQDPEAISAMLDVNLKSLILLTHAFLPGMLTRKRGKIVNNASVSGKMFFPCASTYAASKAGVVAFTESLKQELRGTGVSTLLLITPGVKTAMYDDIFQQYGKHLRLDFMSSISSTAWARAVFAAIEQDKDFCWPSGSSRFGVWFAHHFPNLFERAIRGKFHR